MKSIEEHEIFSTFDPDNIQEWLKYSPEEFILMIITEIQQLNEVTGSWSKIILDAGVTEDIILSIDGISELPTVTKLIDDTFNRSQLINRIIYTARAYAKDKIELNSRQDE